MQKVIIIGSGDQAKVIFHEIINDKNIKILGFGDENRKKMKSYLNIIKQIIKY